MAHKICENEVYIILIHQKSDWQLLSIPSTLILSYVSWYHYKDSKMVKRISSDNILPYGCRHVIVYGVVGQVANQ